MFSHEGKFWKYKDIAIWPRPYQQPHPPVWIPFTGSKETIECAAAGNFGAAIHHPHPGVVQDMIAYFGRKLGENGHRISPDQICMMTDAWVAESGAKAVDEYGAVLSLLQQRAVASRRQSAGAEGQPDGERLCGVVVLRLRAAGERERGRDRPREVRARSIAPTSRRRSRAANLRSATPRK